jgi:hypothetical protein
MGSNVAAAHCCLYPGKISGFFNLDGLPPAFLQIQCAKFLRDGPMIMGVMRAIAWTGLPRFLFSTAMGGFFKEAMKSESFPGEVILGVMCQASNFTATALEYKTLMSCCDLETASWGPIATTNYDLKVMRGMTSAAPGKDRIRWRKTALCDALRLLFLTSHFCGLNL